MTQWSTLQSGNRLHMAEKRGREPKSRSFSLCNSTPELLKSKYLPYWLIIVNIRAILYQPPIYLSNFQSIFTIVHKMM